MNRLLILFVVIALFLYSCHPAKKMQVNTPVVQKDTAAIAILLPSDHAKEDSIAFIKELYRTMMNNRIAFTTFSGKIDMDYEDGNGNKFNGNVHVRMYKDSAIWLSVTAILGIEGLRVYITPDSVKVLDKQNKMYKARSISFLQEVTALPLDLSILQDLLLGNPVFFDSNIVSYTRDVSGGKDGNIILQNIGTFFTNQVTINEADKLLLSSKLTDVDMKKSRSCYLTYSDYENKKSVNFPQERTIHIIDKVKLDIKMNYKQYDFNEKLSFPFSVPKNYDQN